MNDISEIIKIGTVSSVDATKKKARVIFKDTADMVSAELRVLITSPLIAIKKTFDGSDWTCEGSYCSAPRNIPNASFKKSPPDTINLDRELEYAGDKKKNETKVEVHQWLPYVGQTVVAIFLPHGNGSGEGFIIGGL